MTRKVLIPIDVNHADRTDAMMSQVAQIVGQSDTKFVLLNVVPEIPAYVAAQLPETVAHVAQKDAQTFLELVADNYDVRSKSTIKVVQGNPGHQILQTAKDENANLIVIGSHHPGLADYLIGSTAARVVRHANCSVLVVR